MHEQICKSEQILLIFLCAKSLCIGMYPPFLEAHMPED